MAFSISKDLLGNEAASETTVDRASKTVTQSVKYPDSTNSAVQVSVNGLTQYAISKTGVRTDFSYDALGRQISSQSGGPRSVVAISHYNSKGQVDYVQDAATLLTEKGVDAVLTM